MKEMEIEKVRKKIDEIDFEIIKLLSERMEFALRTSRLKTKTQDKEREEEVKDKIAKYSGTLLPEEVSMKLYQEILAHSKKLQKEDLVMVGFQGEHGAHGECATRKFDPTSIPIPYLEFSEVFEGVANGFIDMGIVPVENSTEGAVTEVNDLLIHKDVKIVGEIELPIHHCLVTLPETNHREIRAVYSHPQALAQCRGFISRNGLEPRPFYDTAGAAKMISEGRVEAAGALCSELCADLYNLKIIKKDVEDEASNNTRFIVISSKESEEKGNKCSIIFSTKHESGALFSILRIFSDAKINLTRIESRPIKDEPGNYTFLLDFEGSVKDKKVKKVLKDVEEKTVFYKFMGCYEGAL